MKIFHEAPNAIFNLVQQLTDGDYCLVHLMDENEIYRNHFIKASMKPFKREIILDNSIFELGEAYDEGKYAYWMQYLQPTYTIIPDVLNSREGTLERLEKWFEKFPTTHNFTKPIAVVQGDTEEEAVKCYLDLQNDPRVEKIGISFDSSSHIKDKTFTKQEKMFEHMRGRITFLDRVSNRGRIIHRKPLHLLGCSLPQEMKYYQSYAEGIIDSVDTSSPVVHGFFGIKFTDFGLDDKHPQKLFELINEDVTLDQRLQIAYNIVKFRELAE